VEFVAETANIDVKVIKDEAPAAAPIRCLDFFYLAVCR